MIPRSDELVKAFGEPEQVATLVAVANVGGSDHDSRICMWCDGWQATRKFATTVTRM